ncbi:MAG: hypothetical protein CMF50_02110 [Legionellales bacterium]|nr:hypothetical protein [Legionellales bacterium]|tara:strand:- start:58630 stop:59232 length:603 start_codon:yes stop_codon:yes gene_type:complete
MQDNSLPPYDDVSWALRHASDVASPSESHGLLCGLFCTGAAGRMDGITWAKSAAAAANSENQTCDDEQIGILEELFNATQAKLTSMEFDFELLLPDDESGLEMRASELGSWCLGFVTGLALGGLEIGVNDSHHDEDTREALQRLAEISYIEYEDLDVSEEDEQAFAEVVEYVRMAVLMVFASLTGQESALSQSGAGDTLH